MWRSLRRIEAPPGFWPFNEESHAASGSICVNLSLRDDGYFSRPPSGGSFRYFTFTHLGEAPWYACATV
jgi:hypothetical protein